MQRLQRGCLEQWKTMKAISKTFEVSKGCIESHVSVLFCSVLKAFVSCSFSLGQKSPTLFPMLGCE